MLVGLKPLAKDDLSRALEYYLKRSESAAIGFIDGFERALDRVALFPKSGRSVPGGFRVTRVHRYPFLIYYQIDERRLTVYAVLNTSLEPSRHLSRLLNEEE